MTQKKILKELQIIPEVGSSLAQDLYDLGIRSVKDLTLHDPEVLYNNLCIQQNKKVDRCVLYVFRCAVYFASEKDHNPELLQWWKWKD